jgi:hypothetical protein
MTAMSRLVALLFDEESLFFENGCDDSDFEAVEEESDIVSRNKSNVEDESKIAGSSNREKKSTALNSTFSNIPVKKSLNEELRIPSCSNVRGPNINNGLEFIVVPEKKLITDKSPSTKDDIAILPASTKPIPLRLRSNSAPNVKPLKIDTKSDFQSALNAGTSPTSNSIGAANSPSLPAANRRKWMTTPSFSLATIQEDNDKMDEKSGLSHSADRNDFLSQRSESEIKAGIVVDALDTELILHQKSAKPSKVKQMRVPTVLTSVEVPQKQLNDQGYSEDGSYFNSVSLPGVPNKLPTTDEEIEKAGTAFLDKIGENLSHRYAYLLNLFFCSHHILISV